MKLHRVEAFIGPNNQPSLKLVENAGFKKEGNLREHYLKDGEWQDSGVFSLLKREY
jgi:RimJ/RimL family protein N-acetyltransferase